MKRAYLLIVYDEPDMLAVLARWCTKEGYQVETAADGFEALAKLRDRPFDIVLTDLSMPGMDGLKLLEVLKAFDSSIEVVIMTGQGTMDSAIAALREGRAFDYLKKPLAKLEDLSAVLDRALQKRRKAPESIVRDPDALISQMPSPFEPFTARERDIARLLAEDLDAKAIADQLNLGVGTVRNRLTTIYQKIGTNDRGQAVVLLRRYRF